MSKVLMIGTGDVATVAAFKIVQNSEAFADFMVTSQRKEEHDGTVEVIGKPGIKTAQVDTDDAGQLRPLTNNYQPGLVVSSALPYQDLTIIEAYLACGCNYLDVANYELRDEAHFECS